MKRFKIAVILFFLAVGLANSRTEDMVIVQYGDTIVDRYHREEYASMMIFVGYFKEIVRAEQEGRVYLFVDDNGMRIQWQNRARKAIKEINFHNFMVGPDGEEEEIEETNTSY